MVFNFLSFFLSCGFIKFILHVIWALICFSWRGDALDCGFVVEFKTCDLHFECAKCVCVCGFLEMKVVSG